MSGLQVSADFSGHGLRSTFQTTASCKDIVAGVRASEYQRLPIYNRGYIQILRYST